MSSATGTALADALAVAAAAAAEAGAIARSGQSRIVDVHHKQSTSDLVTEFDLAVERAVIARVRAAFPDDDVIGEEGTADASRGASRRWYIDPIDGTTNFAHGLPFYCTSIALVDEHGPAVAVIEAAALGWRFYATRGGGATLDAPSLGPPRSLSVSRTARLDRALLATGFPYDLRTSPDDNVAAFSAMQRQGQAVRRVGAAALDLAMVAAGWFDGYWERKLKPWDIAAGILLVEEAGGKVTSLDGGRYDLTSGELIASNGHIHDAMGTALAKVP